MRLQDCMLLTLAFALSGCSWVLDLDSVKQEPSGTAGQDNAGSSGASGSSMVASGGAQVTGVTTGAVAGRSASSVLSGGSAGFANVGGTSPSAAGGPGFGGSSADAGREGINGGTRGGEASVAGGTSSLGGSMIAGAAGTASNAGAGGSNPTSGSSGTAGVAGAPTSATTPSSCKNLATRCEGESCCTTIAMPGGTFKMGRSRQSTASDYYAEAEANPTGFADETPEHDATVSRFALDKYEVTVGRFRAFVEAYDAWHKAPAANPQIGDGSNSTATLSIRGRTGWQQNWTPKDTDLPADATAIKAMLKQADANSTWTDSPGANEAFPINSMSWTLAFAFCIWDGGRLPTEAEWEYAAAGGSSNFLFPWGSNDPNADHANFVLTFNSPKVAVGGRTLGSGVFGHRDLAGSVSEWLFDWYSAMFYGTLTDPVACNNCANVEGNDLRVIRGGGWDNITYWLRSTNRGNQNFRMALSDVGIRCARNLP